jgi:Uroporphyrinogen decarboxylase (URO-D)
MASVAPAKTAEELYEEREKRVRDAIELKEPDRVPVMAGGGPSRNTGPRPTDVAAIKAATLRSIAEYRPDVVWAALRDSPGTATEAMKPKRLGTPESGAARDIAYQAIETESLKEDEYDLFLSDPSDFIFRRHLPRIFGTLAPFAKLPPLRNWAGGVPTALFATPEFQEAFEIMFQAGRETMEWRQTTNTFGAELEELGFPPWSHAGAMAPFDTLTNTYRGLRGVMTDIFRQPDKVLAACEMLASWQLQSIAAGAASSQGTTTSGMVTGANARRRGNPRRMVLPLTRGGEAFMSLQQYKTFYWPTLKKVLVAIIDSGAVPIPFFEGCHTSRLELLLELPKGKVICHFQPFTDMVRAKEILGGHLCMVGAVPSSLMTVGSPQDVEEYCKKLIQTVGKGGGFILSPGEAARKPENFQAVMDSARKYGTY